MPARPHGRALDALRPTTMETGTAPFAEGSCTITMGADARALHGLGGRERPAVARGPGRLGHGRVRHAAPSHGRAGHVASGAAPAGALKRSSASSAAHCGPRSTSRRSASVR